MRCLLPTLLLAALLAGCGASARCPQLSSATLDRMRAAAPAPIAALYAQSGQLLDAGTAQVQGRLASLRGHPVVVNKWASWCLPCRQEFPLLQSVARRLSGRVAFLGLDSGDNRGDAQAFLRGCAVPYPSYTDPSTHTAYALHASAFFPNTLFFSPQGRLVFVHQGAYRNEANLLADVRRYLGVSA